MLLFSETEGHFALFKKLLCSLVHLGTREIVNGEAVDNLPLTTGSDLERERVDDARRDSVLISVADDTDACPVISDSAIPKVMNVVASSSCSRGSR